MRDVPCGLLTIDQKGAVRDANAEAARLLGRTTEHVVGQKLSALLPIGSRMFFQTHVFPELALKGRVDELYLSFMTAEGTELPVLFNARRADAPHEDEYDCAFVSIQRRSRFERELIVAQQEAESAARAESRALEQLRAMQAQALAQERLVTLGLLAAGVAHEIANPLSYAFGNVEIAQMELDAPEFPSAPREALAPLLGDVREGLERIRAIVDGIRSLSRATPERRGPVDTRRVVDAALRIAGHELRPRARVVLEAPAPAPVVDGNEGQLVQVLVNLLVNAAHALAPPRGELGCVTVRLRAEPETAVLSVTDTGSGIPADVLPRIFDPFFTTKTNGQGTGLGLAVCDGIVRSFGGAITVESAPGEGSTFRVSLPLWRGTGT